MKIPFECIQSTCGHGTDCSDCYQKHVEKLNARVAELEREVDVLRIYGNKDCTAMADEHLQQSREV